jgi:hypothetical protein
VVRAPQRLKTSVGCPGAARRLSRAYGRPRSPAASAP